MALHHYTYYSHEEWGRGYIGVRTCECLPEEDVDYFGSFKDLTFKPTQKIIIRSDYETRKEANEDEIVLHGFFDVAVNPHFANRSRQTSTKFDRAGVLHTKEVKERMSKTRTGKVQTEQTKKKIAESRIGIAGDKHPWHGQHHTEEARAKIGKSNSGERNWNYGKSTPEEVKKKLRDAVVGRKWFVNVNGETRRSEECPGPEWQPGRKWKP